MGREILLVIAVLIVVATMNCHGAPLEDRNALKRNSILEKLGMGLFSDPYYYRRDYRPRKYRKGKEKRMKKKKKYGGSTDSDETGWSSWGWGSRGGWGWSSDEE